MLNSRDLIGRGIIEDNDRLPLKANDGKCLK
jgi:hypothetical protein